jgi:hypothetical protein
MCCWYDSVNFPDNTYTGNVWYRSVGQNYKAFKFRRTILARQKWKRELDRAAMKNRNLIDETPHNLVL